MQYHDLFLEIGNALLKREMWEKALDCLAVIQECDGVSVNALSCADFPRSRTIRRISTPLRSVITR